MTPTTTKSERELAHRASDGLEVSLYWNEGTNRVTVRLYDVRSDEGFEIEVEARRALDAYRHPFAYAAREQMGETIVATGRLAA